MLDFVQRMVEEHSQLVVRTQALHEYIYSDKSDNDNKVEFANKCIQLSAMKKYKHYHVDLVTIFFPFFYKLHNLL